ncbi:MAG: hypothetical protein KDC05_08010 [Bacteroidales bacterium]|nr:hypothetical protein [Bacteroidales bacterium]
MSKSSLYISIIAVVILAISACSRKSDFVIGENSELVRDNGSGTGTTTWTSDKTYLLDGFVFVNDGQTLTIEPGTVIKARTGQGENASALIVARGGKLIASGSSVNPIIFTCEGDDLEGSVPVFAKGLWGGLIILGNAPLNNEFNEGHIEGIPISEPRGIFGGPDPEDNSGIIRYVSVRHGGTNIGSENEINGITFGGVGNKTTVEYIEVISNNDDGIEFFGGSVDCRFVVSAFNGDDAFDCDLGYNGRGQFWLGIQDPSEGDLLLECSGGIDPELGQPFTIPVLFNCTFIGRGSNITNRAVQFNNFAGGHLGNSILVNQHSGIYLQFKQNYNNSFDQFQMENLVMQNNIFYNVASNVASDIFRVYAETGVNVDSYNQIIAAYFSDAQNVVSDPGIEITDTGYGILPSGNITDNLVEVPDAWFNTVSYKGAFLYDDWARNWTLIHQSGWIY